MYSRQLEQLARQRGRELSEIQRARRTVTSTRASGTPAPEPARNPARKPGGNALRSHTGWALVSIGLRIVASGNR